MTTMPRSLFSKCVSIGLVFQLPLAALAATTPPIPDVSVTEQALSNYDAPAVHVVSEHAPQSGMAARSVVSALGTSTGLDAAENGATFLRASHFSDAAGIAGIESDMAINASSVARGAGTGLGGVHVELAPFGPVSTAAADMGSVQGGRAFVEFNAPANIVRTSVGPRNTAIIPTTPSLPLQSLNPTFVAPRPWWKFW